MRTRSWMTKRTMSSRTMRCKGGLRHGCDGGTCHRPRRHALWPEGTANMGDPLRQTVYRVVQPVDVCAERLSCHPSPIVIERAEQSAPPYLPEGASASPCRPLLTRVRTRTEAAVSCMRASYRTPRTLSRPTTSQMGVDGARCTGRRDRHNVPYRNTEVVTE